MSDHITSIQSHVNRLLEIRPRITVLEAGCGSASCLDMGNEATMVGIDISRKQLERNTILDERILGDVTTHDLPADAYDVIVCWDVLEHLARPEQALLRFRRAVRPGGLIILKLPNLMSVKGLVTKLTPHGFHVWVYRNIYGKKDAGKNDTSPFPTFLRCQVRPSRLRAWSESNGFEVMEEIFYESGLQARAASRNPLLRALLVLAGGLATVASLGRVSLRDTDFAIVLRRPADGGSAQ